jgi:uncharacterized integral membrane protein
MSSEPYVSPDQPPVVPQAPAVAHEEFATPPMTATKPESAVKFTRAGALWSALTVGLLILIVLLVFITQNTESVEMTFLGWHWSLPLGVQILLAAVAGALVTVLVGAARIFQLRRAAKKNLKLTT